MHSWAPATTQMPLSARASLVRRRTTTNEKGELTRGDSAHQQYELSHISRLSEKMAPSPTHRHNKTHTKRTHIDSTFRHSDLQCATAEKKVVQQRARLETYLSTKLKLIFCGSGTADQWSVRCKQSPHTHGACTHALQRSEVGKGARAWRRCAGGIPGGRVRGWDACSTARDACTRRAGWRGIAGSSKVEHLRRQEKNNVVDSSTAACRPRREARPYQARRKGPQKIEKD